MRKFTTLLALILGLIPLCAAGAFAQPSGTSVKPIASTAMSTPDMTIDLMVVERKAGVLTIKWAVRNAGAKDATVDFSLVGRSVTTYAVDEENGAKYYVLTDKEGHALASEHEYLGSDTYGVEDTVKAGATGRYWMKLPAPPAEVKSIGIFFTGADPFDGVTITEKQ
ncbi:MAG: hypothetical protein AB1714_01880 [Acidobacteriota bacterium]